MASKWLHLVKKTSKTAQNRCAIMREKRVLGCIVGRYSNCDVCDTAHEGAFYQLFVWLSSATSFEPISGNIDVPLGIY